MESATRRGLTESENGDDAAQRQEQRMARVQRSLEVQTGTNDEILGDVEEPGSTGGRSRYGRRTSAVGRFVP